MISFGEIIIADSEPFNDPYDGSEYTMFVKFASIRDTLELDEVNYNNETRRLTRLLNRWKSFASPSALASQGYYPQVPIQYKIKVMLEEHPV